MIVEERELTISEVEEINKRMILQRELVELEKWFKEYDRITIEHARCTRMGIECHHNIEEMDSEAVVKQVRISSIRQILQTEK